MTTIRKYECNFCRTAYMPNADLVGVYWLTNSTARAVLQLSNAENHICKNCLSAFRSDAFKTCFTESP